MSEEYLVKSGAIWVSPTPGQPLSGFRIPDSDGWLIPPMDSQNRFVLGCPEEVWAEFPVQIPPAHPTFRHVTVNNDGTVCSAIMDRIWEYHFLDYQFIYHPYHFLSMKGGMWDTFRKNIRKYPTRSKGDLIYNHIPPDALAGHERLIADWFDRKGQTYDAETMTRFVMMGEHKAGLYLNGRLVGLNIWDENFHYVNFRYCIDDGSPFIQEYLRYKFYTDLGIQSCNKLINDGGSLGSEGLLQFKMKLNPLQVLRVYSIKPKV